MIDPEEMAKVDQATAFLAENLPPFAFKFYTNLQEEGFSEERAFELTKHYVLNIKGDS